MVILAVVAAGSAVAQEATQTTDGFGADFGRIVGSEAGCGLTYRPEAVREAIARNVAPGDLKFNSIFGAYSSMAADGLQEMTPTEKLVHCATVERNARALGLIP